MILCSVLLISVTLLEPVKVVQWSSPTQIDGELLSVGNQGISVRVEGGNVPVLIPWFDVREESISADEVDSYSATAITAWRAHTRLQRNDFHGALMEYEKLSDVYE